MCAKFNNDIYDDTKKNTEECFIDGCSLHTEAFVSANKIKCIFHNYFPMSCGLWSRLHVMPFFAALPTFQLYLCICLFLFIYACAVALISSCWAHVGRKKPLSITFSYIFDHLKIGWVETKSVKLFITGNKSYILICCVIYFFYFSMCFMFVS